MIVIANKTSEYWKKRFEILESASNSYGLDTYRQIEPAFEVAQRQIEKEIDIWFGRFAKNNAVTIDEARKYLTSSELKEFKWDVQEYIKKGRENALNQQWVKELENASSKYHISRLEALKIRTQNAAEVAFGNELDEIDAMARRVYKDNYYHSIFEVQKGFNVGWDIGQVDEKKLSRIISKPWAADGKNFSERIWGQRTQLVNELHQQLTRTCVLGKAPDGAIEAIAKKFDVTKKQAGRLVMTEQAYFHSISQKDAFNELDVEEYEIVATLDSHTSSICQEMDGQHFPMKDYEPGVTAPPFHVWCRTVTVPYFEDNYGGERAARDEDGNTYYVPDNMTYKNWASEYINDEIDIKKGIRNVKEKIYNKYDVLTRERPPKSLVEIVSGNLSLESAIDNAPEPFKSILMSKSQDIKFAKTDCIGSQRYNTRHGIFINLNKNLSDTRGQWTTLFHEIGHNVDKLSGRISKNSTFVNFLRTDFENFTKGYSSWHNISIDETYNQLSARLMKQSNEESHIMSDLFDALSGGKCKGHYGHPKGYWKSERVISKEAFAHFFSASALDNKIKLAKIKQVFPNAYDEFLRLVGGIK